MSTYLKKRFITHIAIAASGLILLILLIIKGSMEEAFTQYLYYIGIALLTVGIVRIIQFLPALRDKAKAEEMENKYKDEMYRQIDHSAVYTSFTVILIAEAVGIGVLYFIDKPELATFLSVLIAVQSIIYLTIYVIYKKKY